MAVPYDRTVLGQVYDANQIYNQYDDVLPQDYGYTGLIEDESEFDTPYTMRSRPGILSAYDRLTGPIKSTFKKYGAPIMGGLLSAFTGIPGLGFLMRNLPNDPYAQNRIDMYGTHRGSDGFIKDKFGYNVGNTLLTNNFMQPGSNSYRSYALEGLKGLDQTLANRYYQETYGKSFDEVKKDIQKKNDPFDSGSVIDMGSDYQGGGGDENKDFNAGPKGVDAGTADVQDYADIYSHGGRVGYVKGGLANMLGRQGFKKGGRQDPMGGTMEQTTQELREAAPDQFGGEMNINSGGENNQNNSLTVPKTNYIDIESDLIRKDPYVNFNVTSPLDIARLRSTMGFRNLLENDDFSLEGDLTTNLGNFSTITDLTEEGVGPTTVNYNNMSAIINPDKTLGNVEYNRGPLSVGYSGDGNYYAKLGINFKDGGLTSL